MVASTACLEATRGGVEHDAAGRGVDVRAWRHCGEHHRYFHLPRPTPPPRDVLHAPLTAASSSHLRRDKNLHRGDAQPTTRGAANGIEIATHPALVAPMRNAAQETLDQALTGTTTVREALSWVSAAGLHARDDGNAHASVGRHYVFQTDCAPDGLGANFNYIKIALWVALRLNFKLVWNAANFVSENTPQVRLFFIILNDCILNNFNL